jgi:hypothetical protein
MTSWFTFIGVALALLIIINLTVAIWQWRARVDRADWEHRTKTDLVRGVYTDERLAKLHVIEPDGFGKVTRLDVPPSD